MKMCTEFASYKRIIFAIFSAQNSDNPSYNICSVALHQKDSLYRMHLLQLVEYEYFTTTVQNIYKFDNCTSDNILVRCLTIRQRV